MCDMLCRCGVFCFLHLPTKCGLPRVTVPVLDLQNLPADWSPKLPVEEDVGRVVPYTPVLLLEVQLTQAMLLDFGQDPDGIASEGSMSHVCPVYVLRSHCCC